MGLFNTLAKMADSGMKAVENGALEKTLASAVDKLEAGLDKAVESAEKVAEAPEKMLEKVEAKHEQMTKTAQNIRQQAAKTINVVQK
jgi:F0F1-type ATP synthase membrane subunit b/b'